MKVKLAVIACICILHVAIALVALGLMTKVETTWKFCHEINKIVILITQKMCANNERDVTYFFASVALKLCTKAHLWLIFTMT